MPTYEYRCGACGKQQDIFQKMSDPTLTVCPLCGEPKLERLISASAFALRGGGWYADGYGGSGGSSSSSSEGGSSTGGKSDGAKGESKPESTKADTAKSDGGSSASSSTTTDAAKPKPEPAKTGG